MFGDPVTNTNDREIRPFSDFMTNIRYGTSQPPAFSEDGQYKFIRATNIKGGRITETDMLRINQEAADKIQKCKLDGNEIIIVRSGANTGDTCVVTEGYRDQYAGYDIIVSLDLSKANPVFFNELMNTHYMQSVIKPLTVRSAQPHLNTKQVQNLPMLIATLDEQNLFADFVQQSDKSKFVRFKSQFIEMFGDPAINSKGLPVAKLPDLGENLDNKRIPITGGNRKAGEYPYYGASGIVDYVADYIFDDDLLLISEDGANLVARVTPIAFPSTGKVWINNHAHVIKFKSMAMQCYVESLLNMMDISPYVTGTAQPKLNQAKLNSIPIPVPEESQIREYLEFVKQRDKSK